MLIPCPLPFQNEKQSETALSRNVVKGGNRAGSLVQRSINIKEGCLTEFHFLFYEQNTIFEGGKKKRKGKKRQQKRVVVYIAGS